MNLKVFSWFVMPDTLKKTPTQLTQTPTPHSLHDDVIKRKHFPRNWPLVWGIHRSPVNSPHKGQWRGAFMFSLICVWIKDWVNNREAGDLRRYRIPLWRHRNVTHWPTYSLPISHSFFPCTHSPSHSLAHINTLAQHLEYGFVSNWHLKQMFTVIKETNEHYH